MVVARVILKEARSYRQGGRRFIKDVPQIIRGDEVKQFVDNGYFTVSILKGKDELDKSTSSSAPAKAPAKPAKDEDDEDDDTPAKKSGTGLKKRT